MKTVKIFLSSTFSDFREERLEVIEVFRRMRTVEHLDIDLITIEDFGFSASQPIEKCTDLLSSADAYLGLLGQRYGSMPPGGRRSYTEREYRCAPQRNMPMFLLERTGKVLPSDTETDPRKLEFAYVGNYTPDIRTDGGSKRVIELSGTGAQTALNFYSAQFQQLWARSCPSWR
jgi:hypothetical protein